MPQRLAGQLVDGGDPVADEPVFVVDTGPTDESNWSIVATDRSAGDGSWSVTVPNADAERYHAVAQFEESGTLKNALSKPFLTSQPFAQPGLVTVGFDVLSPAVSVGIAIPDSAVNRWPLDEGSGQTATDEIGGIDLSLTFDRWSEADYVGGFALEFEEDDEATGGSVPDQIDVDSDYSVEIWIDPDTAVSNNGPQVILARQGDNNRFAMNLTSDFDELRAGIFDGSLTAQTSGSISDYDGLIQAVYAYNSSDTGATLYLNADEQTGTNETNFTGADNGTFAVGWSGRSGVDRGYGGLVDLPQVHDETLDQDQVQDLYDDHPST